MRWPALSMSSRLLAVLVTSLLISQAISALLYLREGSSMAELSRESSAGAAGLISMLDALDPDSRERLENSMRPTADRASLIEKSRLRSVSESYRRAVADHLQEALTAHKDLQVLPSDPARSVDIVLPDSLAPSHDATGRAFDIVTTLRGGQALTLRVIAPSRVVSSLRLVLFFLLTLIATLCVGSFMLTRSMTRPLHRLALAADAVGRGARIAAIPESGPRELRTAARAFNRMQNRLQRYLGGRTRILTAMSHDLRTPITRLRLRLASIADPVLHTKMASDLEQMASMVQESLESLQGLEATESLQPGAHRIAGARPAIGISGIGFYAGATERHSRLGARSTASAAPGTDESDR
jgi:methyl-accepting chemotaxis protein